MFLVVRQLGLIGFYDIWHSNFYCCNPITSGYFFQKKGKAEVFPKVHRPIDRAKSLVSARQIRFASPWRGHLSRMNPQENCQFTKPDNAYYWPLPTIAIQNSSNLIYNLRLSRNARQCAYSDKTCFFTVPLEKKIVILAERINMHAACLGEDSAKSQIEASQGHCNKCNFAEFFLI